MEIHVDYNPSPKDHYFISVVLNDQEVISFDKTLKGHRMLKQVFKEKRPFPENAVFNSEWNTIVLNNGTFDHEFHTQWIDMGKCDWLNGEIWESVWEKPISEELSNKLLHYSQLISDHYKDLRKYSCEVRQFEQLLTNELTTVSNR